MSSTIPPLTTYFLPKISQENQQPNPTAPNNPILTKELPILEPESVPINGFQRKKRKNYNTGKLNRARKCSFNTKTENELDLQYSSSLDQKNSVNGSVRNIFYRAQGRKRSNTETEIQMDRRDQAGSRRRKSTTMGPSAFGVPLYETSTSYHHQQNHIKAYDSGSDSDIQVDERVPLINIWSSGPAEYGDFGTNLPMTSKQESNRRHSIHSSNSSNKKNPLENSSPTISSHFDGYNVNYPPSIPVSPSLEPSRVMDFGDILAGNEFNGSKRASSVNVSDGISVDAADARSRNGSPHRPLGYERRRKISLQTAENICFSGKEYVKHKVKKEFVLGHGPRRRRGKWPDLAVLDEWSRFEKEGTSNERRAKKITEPQLIGGRLRPIHKFWHRAEDDAPYRFTYFNEQFQSTIHSQTISELVQPGGSFHELFVPEPPELSDSSESGSENGDLEEESVASLTLNSQQKPTRAESFSGMDSIYDSKEESSTISPNDKRIPELKEIPSPMLKADKPKKYGERPIWWLDVLSPTDAEMKVLSATFGIHPLTAEDILLQEAREKVELFHDYYFINYRSFEQDGNNEDYLEPVNMYVVVFREGIISFHFSLTPHPANVRRRIRQLKDYLILSSDWISYAIIDDITDVFAPLIQSIEDEVDNIDDAILKLHSPIPEGKPKKNDEKCPEPGDGISIESGGDMLRRVGDCRKKVMGLYRLLGNKADVIKGFAKRCNENWKIAPRSEIGLYLGDIQDHIVTMTGNLAHYEKFVNSPFIGILLIYPRILARSHANYLAQINIRMNERHEQTADVLGKLTVLGTIVLPMNIITGLWGMNVWVPGQDAEGDLTWFWCLTAGLLFFGLTCFMIAKVLYRIV